MKHLRYFDYPLENNKWKVYITHLYALGRFFPYIKADNRRYTIPKWAEHLVNNTLGRISVRLTLESNK